MSPCVAQHCFLWNMRHTTRWLWYGLGEQSTLRITERDTARIETERALVTLIDTSSLDSRLSQAKRQNAHHPRMDRPILCRLCTYGTFCSWAHASRMVAEHGCSMLIHGSMTYANGTKADAEVSITTCHPRSARSLLSHSLWTEKSQSIRPSPAEHGKQQLDLDTERDNERSLSSGSTMF